MSKKLQIVGAIKTPVPDWTQTDETKNDYIKNKPTNISVFTNDAGYLTDVPDEIFVGDGDMPEGATIQILMGDSNEEQTLMGELKEYINENLQAAKDSGEFDGKSAYQYAQDGGYQGTEEEFAEKFARLMEYSVWGYVGENNNIILESDLTDGAYTIKYEMKDGSTVDIGELTI